MCSTFCNNLIYRKVFFPVHHEVNSLKSKCNVLPISYPKSRDSRYAAVLRLSYTPLIATIYGKCKIWSFLVEEVFLRIAISIYVRSVSFLYILVVSQPFDLPGIALIARVLQLCGDRTSVFSLNSSCGLWMILLVTIWLNV